MKYKCLVLDHDDTVVNSTATIHYPCFIEYLEIYYPHLVKNYTLESYFVKNFHPGVVELFVDEIGMSQEELAHEEAYWSEYVKGHIPTAYSGIRELMADFREAGGIIAVDSHSLIKYIKRDYEYNRLPTPDVIYSWDLPEEQRKPNAYPLLEIMKTYQLSPGELLVVDDMKPAREMAKKAAVPIAFAKWGKINCPEICREMEELCDYSFSAAKELEDFLFNV